MSTDVRPKRRYQPWEVSKIIFQVADYTTVDEVNEYIDMIMLAEETELLEGIRHACSYYLSSNTQSEHLCDITMEKLIAHEIPFKEVVGSPRLNGMSLIIQYKQCFP